MPDAKLTGLLQHREKLLAYIRKKTGEADLAEDILQDSLLKALRAADNLRDDAKLLPWFYRIVNNTIADVYRRRQRVAATLGMADSDAEIAAAADDEQQLCECFRVLIPTLKPEYGELIERLDLRDEDAAAVARQLNITPNNLKVRRHRARQALREQLEQTCRVCAKHGCLDCHCNQTDQITPR